MQWKRNKIAAKLFEINSEIEKEIRELRVLGLTEEEIEGYIEFYKDHWYRWLLKKDLD